MMMAVASDLPENRWHERLFVGLAAVTPLLGAVAPLGLTPVLIAAAVAALLIHGPRSLLSTLPRWALVFSSTLLVWGLASALWALDPARAIHKVGQLAVLVAAGLVLLGSARSLSTSARTTAQSALLLGLIGACALFIFEVAFQAPLSRLLVKPPADLPLLITYYNRGATVAAILMIPAVLVLGHRRGWKLAAGFAAVGMVALAVLNSRTAVAGMILGLGVAVLALRWPKAMVRLVPVGMALLIVLMPVVPGIALSSPERNVFLRTEGGHYRVLSLFHRFRIWEFTVEKIEERPLLGWGLDSSRLLPGGQVKTDAGGGERLALHPHNGPLQIRVELGFPGVLLAAGLVLAAVLRARRVETANAAMILGVAVVAITVASMSYGMWQSWWVSALWIASVLTSVVALPQRAEP